MRVLLLFLVLLLFGAGAAAQNPPACDDLMEIADALEDLAVALDEDVQILEDSEADRVLGELTDALYDLAEVEDDAVLQSRADELALAWEAMDLDGFQASLDDTIARLDGIHRRDCP
mgnify:CR=1 FL=1